MLFSPYGAQPKVCWRRLGEESTKLFGYIFLLFRNNNQIIVSEYYFSKGIFFPTDSLSA